MENCFVNPQNCAIIILQTKIDFVVSSMLTALPPQRIFRGFRKKKKNQSESFFICKIIIAQFCAFTKQFSI